MTIPVNSAADVEAPARPQDVGILAMEMYFPQRVRVSRVSHARQPVFTLDGIVYFGGGA